VKVVGFTFIRNAIKYDYPVVEAIQSILPLCDEVVVAVGNSEDGTYDLIKAIHPSKIKIIETTWDDTLREGGAVLAVETNKALKAITSDADWAIYIQGDEVIHEKYHPVIRAGMAQHLNSSNVDGLLFKYLHFYGSYDFVGVTDNWYPYEIRIIKNNSSIYSYKDAQGFRKGDNQKLRVKEIDAYIYHYGWVKEPEAMQKKKVDFNKMYHDDAWIDQNIAKVDRFDYFSEVSALNRFEDTHPAVMVDRINKRNWKFEYDISFNNISFKYKLKKFLKNYLALDFSYKNYIRL